MDLEKKIESARETGTPVEDLQQQLSSLVLPTCRSPSCVVFFYLFCVSSFFYVFSFFPLTLDLFVHLQSWCGRGSSFQTKKCSPKVRTSNHPSHPSSWALLTSRQWPTRPERKKETPKKRSPNPNRLQQHMTCASVAWYVVSSLTGALTVTQYLTHKHFANFCRCIFLTLLLFPRSLAEGPGRKRAGGCNSGVQVIEDAEHQMRCLWNDG